MTTIGFGPQTIAHRSAGAGREWLVTDGLGGYAMGTVAGLRTRRYHGLLVVATDPPGGRMLALASLDPVLVLGDRRVPLATHRWADGTLAPTGHDHLASFTLTDGIPRWRWQVGGVVLDREIAMVHGRPAVAITHRLLAADGPVRLEFEVLCTWRDVHGERTAASTPTLDATADGFVFEDRFRVAGPGFVPDGTWYLGVRHDEEAARGLTATEDLFRAGRFVADPAVGEVVEVRAWADQLADEPPSATEVVDTARARAQVLLRRADADPGDAIDGQLVLAADAFLTAGPTVVAGYPWFGDWSRDTMLSYDGLLLWTGRADEGRRLLQRAAASLSDGMLANTADTGRLEYNTVDGTLWFVHAVGRHVAATTDTDLAAELLPALRAIVAHHRDGTRYGIAVDPADGLLTQGAPGVALTWMDARIDGVPVTPRPGKPIEVNALWVNALTTTALLAELVGEDAGDLHAAAERAARSLRRRFVVDGRVLDVVDGPDGDDAALRPNQLLAFSLPHAPLGDRELVARCGRALLTPLGLRSLAPDDPAYQGRHRGDGATRDRAYHQGTVWPWLLGPYVDACRRTGIDASTLLEPLERHLAEWGVGSVSETADGDAPHDATGAPFQAWSVAELLRARRLLQGRRLPRGAAR
ncbi:MAG: amylo-alpha-1,6-glucosidase [Nitriliruptoraceae bacterium]